MALKWHGLILTYTSYVKLSLHPQRIDSGYTLGGGL